MLGDTATDVFNYTVSDGTATDTATITITILGARMHDPLHRNDVGLIVEGGTLTVANGANANCLQEVTMPRENIQEMY